MVGFKTLGGRLVLNTISGVLEYPMGILPPYWGLNHPIQKFMVYLHIGPKLLLRLYKACIRGG